MSEKPTQLEGEDKEEFLLTVGKQLARTSTAFGKRIDDEQLATMASALLIRLQGDGWIITPPALELTNQIL